LAKTDDGEFELILGNRQLISVFLIIVILVGVFFAMGYIVGRNSAAPATVAGNTQGGKQMVVEPASRKDTEQASTTQPSPTGPPVSTEAPSTAAPDKKPPSNPPAAEKTEPVKREPVTPPPPEKKPEPPPERAPAAAVDQPSPGIYWQVAASPRAGAEVVAGALRKKGMQVTLVPVPDKNLFRVLVGPYPDASSAATVRTQLEDAGFKGPIQKKF
jgi:outer membrane biosynthesis protein TonB